MRLELFTRVSGFFFNEKKSNENIETLGKSSVFGAAAAYAVAKR
jgi:hypothetical protein